MKAVITDNEMKIEKKGIYSREVVNVTNMVLTIFEQK